MIDEGCINQDDAVPSRKAVARSWKLWIDASENGKQVDWFW